MGTKSMLAAGPAVLLSHCLRSQRRLALVVVLVLVALASSFFPAAWGVVISLDGAADSLLPFFEKHGASTRRRLADLGNKTMLHVAVESDNVDAIEYVLQQLASQLGEGRRLRSELRVRDPSGQTPLHLARSAAATRLLLESGASVVSCWSLLAPLSLSLCFCFCICVPPPPPPPRLTCQRNAGRQGQQWIHPSAPCRVVALSFA